MDSMSVLLTAALVVFVVSLGGAAVFGAYPLLVGVVCVFRNRPVRPGPIGDPTVSLVVVVRNAEKLILDKIRNSLALDYPRDRLQIVFFSDGSEDRTAEIIAAHEEGRLRLLVARSHEGKIRGMNRAVEACTGNVIVFSDADALLKPDAIRRLVERLADPEVGGVCGQRKIGRDNAEMKEAQGGYIRFDSWIKILETRVGSITSNDGKLYAVRRELFRPIPGDVADDAFVQLAVVRQGRRFVFEPRAVAYVAVPSRTSEHEVKRRRRIVCTGLRGIYRMRALLNPLRFGLFSIGLLVNKVLRRLLPVLLLGLLASSIVLSLVHGWAQMVAGSLGLLLLAALLHRAVPRRLLRGVFRKLASFPYYFFLGNYGTLLGLLDFLRGRRIGKWDPVKTD